MLEGIVNRTYLSRFSKSLLNCHAYHSNLLARFEIELSLLWESAEQKITSKGKNQSLKEGLQVQQDFILVLRDMSIGCIEKAAVRVAASLIYSTREYLYRFS